MKLSVRVKPYLVFFGTNSLLNLSWVQKWLSYFCGDFPLEIALKSHKWNHANTGSSSSALDLQTGLWHPGSETLQWKSNGCQGPRLMKILWRPSLHLERALSSLYAFAKVLFLQVSVSRGILSVFLAGIVSSHRDAESSRME